jgi:hypothetical protein
MIILVPSFGRNFGGHFVGALGLHRFRFCASSNWRCPRYALLWMKKPAKPSERRLTATPLPQ